MIYEAMVQPKHVRKPLFVRSREFVHGSLAGRLFHCTCQSPMPSYGSMGQGPRLGAVSRNMLILCIMHNYLAHSILHVLSMARQGVLHCHDLRGSMA